MANNKESDLVEAALITALSTMDDIEEGDVLTDWVLVAFVTNPEESKGGGYSMLFSNGNLPTHVARGLLHTGLVKMQFDGLISTEDE